MEIEMNDREEVFVNIQGYKHAGIRIGKDLDGQLCVYVWDGTTEDCNKKIPILK